jgi:hypothetical protein
VGRRPVKKRLVVMLLCFLLVPPFPAFATSVVALLEPNGITIAADSVGIESLINRSGPVRHSICKILCVHRLCFAAAGLYVEPNIGYNLWPVAERELLAGGSVEEVAERFARVVEPLVPKLVAIVQKKYPDQYAKWVGGKAVLQYLFAGFDPKGKPLAVRVETKMNPEGNSAPGTPIS